MPLENLVLSMKSAGITQVLNFPFPTPPDAESLRYAERTLEYIGAIKDNVPTALGRHASYFPVHPRYAKMILVAAGYSGIANLLGYIIALVSGLSIGQVFEQVDAKSREYYVAMQV